MHLLDKLWEGRIHRPGFGEVEQQDTGVEILSAYNTGVAHGVADVHGSSQLLSLEVSLPERTQVMANEDIRIYVEDALDRYKLQERELSPFSSSIR